MYVAYKHIRATTFLSQRSQMALNQFQMKSGRMIAIMDVRTFDHIMIFQERILRVQRLLCSLNQLVLES